MTPPGRAAGGHPSYTARWPRKWAIALTDPPPPSTRPLG
jgi:hypothetical protein